MKRQRTRSVMFGVMLLWLSGEVGADRPYPRNQLRGSQFELCAPLVEAQNMAKNDPVRWQRLYAACLAEVQMQRATPPQQPTPPYWYAVPPGVFLPAY